jgi:hypothetical protein
MMIGITAWQQQVPLSQPYTGKNVWRIPLKPVVATRPISARTARYRRAIALAVNGVPIFNALNNGGEDAYLAGELDAIVGLAIGCRKLQRGHGRATQRVTWLRRPGRWCAET